MQCVRKGTIARLAHRHGLKRRVRTHCMRPYMEGVRQLTRAGHCRRMRTHCMRPYMGDTMPPHVGASPSLLGERVGGGTLPCRAPRCLEPLNMQRATTHTAAMPHAAVCIAACPAAAATLCSYATYSISCRNDVFFTLRNSV